MMAYVCDPAFESLRYSLLMPILSHLDLSSYKYDNYVLILNLNYLFYNKLAFNT
jgi:hypothetical protein